MNRSESKYYNTACMMDEALIQLLEKKDFEYITIKEVCNRAGVNRSTFYLHYETMSDLLEESAQFILKNFYIHMREADNFKMQNGDDGITEHIKNSTLDELYLVTPQYLTPYLEFIRENKRIFRTLLQNVGLFKWEKTYEYMYQKMFSPILDRYGQPENVKPYFVSFYIHGLMAIITEWLQVDCRESVDEIIEIIKLCMNR